MNQTLEKSLNIAKLLYQKGDFLEALSAFELANSDALESGETSVSLDCIRLKLQCLSELEQFEKAEAQMATVTKIVRESQDVTLLVRAHFITAFYHLQKRDIPQAQENLGLTIQLATTAQDLEYLARALMLETYLYALSSQKNWDSALRSVEKLDLLLQSTRLPDIEVTAILLKAHIATERGSFEDAATYLWSAYEKAQTQGHHVLVPSLLFQLSRLHQTLGQKTQAQLFYELCLRGVDPIKHPRQYRTFIRESEFERATTRLQFDFIVNQESRILQEKQRGYIDFKNQHLLLDLALLFLKNPGKRYSKEDLLEEVWKQAYDPSMHDNLIYVSIKRLRALIEPDAENPRYILRDRRGYYLSSSCSISFEVPQETQI